VQVRRAARRVEPHEEHAQDGARHRVEHIGPERLLEQRPMEHRGLAPEVEDDLHDEIAW